MSRLVHLLPLLLLACDVAPRDTDEHEHDTDTIGGTPTGSSVEVPIRAAEGGEVALGDATLAIPPGALAADTTISVTSGAPTDALPDAASLQGLVYNFGPDGTAFTIPAELSLPLPAAPPSGSAAVVSWLDEAAGAWIDLPTTAAGGAVVAEVEHFTLFVVRFVDATGALSCEPFVACEGDPTGSWTLDTACIEGDPSGGDCPTATYTLDVVATGYLNLEAGGAYDVSLNLVGDLIADVPASCLPAIADCSEISDIDVGRTCTGSTPSVDGCECVEALEEHSDDAGTWQTHGSQLSLRDTEGNVSNLEFCLDGDTLSIFEREDGAVYWFRR